MDSFDYSACGGTHCPQTAMIGLLKILKTETKNKKLRVHFAAGHQALSYFQRDQNIVAEISGQLSTAPDEVVHSANQQTEQLRLAQGELKKLRAEMLSLEAHKLGQRAEPFEPYKLVLATFKDRPINELRTLGKLLREEEDVIAVLAGYDGQKLSLVVSCADNTGVSAKELLAKQLGQIGGKGGGDAKIAQGGGKATESQIKAFFGNTRDYILALISSK